MIDIEEVKDKVVDICTSVGGGLPYDIDQIEGENWDSLAEYLRKMAQHMCVGGNRVAAYAAIASRKANAEYGR